MTRVAKAAVGGAMLGTLPLRVARMIAEHWLERAHTGGTRNAYSALIALRDEDVDLDLRLRALASRAG